MVSIIIINYNTIKLTMNCIESIERIVQYENEVIVVDNASSEPGVEQIQSRFPNVRLVRSPSNIGFSRGNNLGIASSKGDYILLLNSDTLLVNDVVTALKNFLQCKPMVAAVTAKLRYPDGRVQHNCQRFPSLWYLLFEFLRLQKFLPRRIAGRILLGYFFDYQSIVYPDWIWGTCFMIPREALNRLPGGKLADDFFMYGEDIQWCLEFRKLGYEIGFEPAAEVIHLMGKSGGDKTAFMKMSHKEIMKKYYTPLHRECISAIEDLLEWSQR
jgi:GT2 family glycosyltransferase